MRRQKDKKTKRQKESFILWCQVSLALLRCFHFALEKGWYVQKFTPMWIDFLQRMCASKKARAKSKMPVFACRFNFKSLMFCHPATLVPRIPDSFQQEGAWMEIQFTLPFLSLPWCEKHKMWKNILLSVSSGRLTIWWGPFAKKVPPISITTCWT